MHVLTTGGYVYEAPTAMMAAHSLQPSIQIAPISEVPMSAYQAGRDSQLQLQLDRQAVTVSAYTRDTGLLEVSSHQVSLITLLLVSRIST